MKETRDHMLHNAFKEPAEFKHGKAASWMLQTSNKNKLVQSFSLKTISRLKLVYYFATPN